MSALEATEGCAGGRSSESLTTDKVRRCCVSDFRAAQAQRRSMGGRGGGLWGGAHLPPPRRRRPCSPLKMHFPLSRTEGPELNPFPSFSAAHGPTCREPKCRCGQRNARPRPQGGHRKGSEELPACSLLFVRCTLDRVSGTCRMVLQDLTRVS